MRFIIRHFLLVVLLMLPVGRAQAQALLFDAEALDWLETVSAPLVANAGIAATQTVTFRLVNDSSLNAFVDRTRTVHLHTGLILRAQNAAEVIGVLAHEIGHVKGQHLLNISTVQKDVTPPLIIAGLLGAAAAVAGQGQAAAAILTGGQAAALGQLFRFSRIQEREADRIAYDLLDASGYSTAGLGSFFETLRRDEQLYGRTPPPYLTTHPLTEDRLTLARQQQNRNVNSTQPDEQRFQRVQAKLYALTQPPQRTLQQYRSTTEGDVLAQAIAYGLLGNADEALSRAEKLLLAAPQNPFNHELLGHIYMDHGQLVQAEKAFDKALALKPENTLLRLAYAQALLANSKHAQAVDELQRVRLVQPRWPVVWQDLSRAYGAQQQLAEAHLALAELALLRQNKQDVRLHLNTAKQHIDAESNTSSREKLDLWFKNLQAELELL